MLAVVDANKQFGNLIRGHMVGKDYREVGRASRVHFGTLYSWARGDDLPATFEKVRQLTRALRLAEEEEAQLREVWEFARKSAEAGKVVDALVNLAEDQPESLTYEPDLEEVDISGWRGAERLSPETVEKANRAIRGILSEVRRRN